MPTAVSAQTSKERPEEGQVPKQAATKQQLTPAHTTSLQTLINGFSLTSGMSPLPTASRLPHCLHNWLQITSDQWVIQVVKGYKLDLMSTPLQRIPPRPLEAKGHHSMEEEIQKLVAKGAIKKVTSCPSQFLSQIFLVPRTDQRGW